MGKSWESILELTNPFSLPRADILGAFSYHGYTYKL